MTPMLAGNTYDLRVWTGGLERRFACSARRFCAEFGSSSEDRVRVIDLPASWYQQDVRFPLGILLVNVAFAFAFAFIA